MFLFKNPIGQLLFFVLAYGTREPQFVLLETDEGHPSVARGDDLRGVIMCPVDINDTEIRAHKLERK